MPRASKRTANFPRLPLLGPILALSLSLALAMPAAARRAPSGPIGAALSAGIGAQWPLRGKEGGSNLLLGTDLASGPHLLEIRHVWFWHPGFAYMTSVDRVATFAYGHTLGVPRLFGCIGFGLYEDYETPGIQVGVRLGLNRFGLEGYWVSKDYPAAGINLTFATGDLLDQGRAAATGLKRAWRSGRRRPCPSRLPSPACSRRRGRRSRS